MSNIHFLSWAEQDTLFKLSCADAETCSQLSSVDNPLPSLQKSECEHGTKKMAIPRLAEGAESAFTSPGRFHRRHVRRACESCRQRKTKCTGDKSGCRNCREAGIICCYTDGKREKSKRQLASLSSKVQAYEDVIKKLSSRFGVSDEQLVNIALAVDSASELTLNPDSGSASTGEHKTVRGSGSEEPSDQPTSGDPLEFIDHTEEDFNKDETTRATGFIGRSSEIAWLQRLSKEVNNECDGWPSTNSTTDDDNGLPSPTLTPRADGPSEPRVASTNYYLDDSDVSITEQVDTYGVPSRETATKLLNTYLTSVHPSFPIIGILTFVSQFQVFFSQPSLKPGNKWLAILNLIFAIAAKHGQLTETDWEDEEDDHQSYFARARMLSMEDQLLQHPDLQQLQVEGLACFYMIASGHINRAWKLCGSAVRGALALGLHLRNLGSCTSDSSKEIRYRVWWSLYTVEHLLTVITGRPSCIIDSSCTTPLPVPFDESDFQKEEVAHMISAAGRAASDSLDRASFHNSAANLDSNTDDDNCDSPAECETRMTKAEYLKSLPPCMSLYFLQLTSLTTIAKRMTIKLYSPEALQSPWASTEFTIQSLMLDIDTWFMNLPSAYDFTSTQTHCPLGQRMGLAFLFYSTKIGITRPCLRRLEASPQEGDRAHEFCSKTAAECVESACHMLTLFPDAPDAALLHRITPWWCTLHYLMQSSTVLLLELSFRAQHVPEKATMVSKAAKKAVDWLSTLSKMNDASEKAWKLCDGFLQRLPSNLENDNNNNNNNNNNISELAEQESSGGSLLDELEMDEPDIAGPDIAELSALSNDQGVDDFAFGASDILPMNAAELDTTGGELDSIACSPMEQSGTSPLGMTVPCGFDPPDMLDPFIKQEKSSYEDYFPLRPSHGPDYGVFLPTRTQHRS
ncbi:uncharacterized protein N7477_002336 [Penicillium maclennaniae]|uniref:uncharacterized protein n=1 Tax=Penicillium maclennaniae TaxID=1343394 RepID=UPI0025401D2D|nr:uncharacterized protein N7477_002336 [Penicillium maclennaniae]KAJ5676703.1 hypothetical protein N7477_002336 [Penicillium maclennaniae]